jgi:hypothetical protein
MSKKSYLDRQAEKNQLAADETQADADNEAQVVEQEKQALLEVANAAADLAAKASTATEAKRTFWQAVKEYVMGKETDAGA